MDNQGRLSKIWNAVFIYTRPKMLVTFCLGVSSGFPLTLILSTLYYWLSEVGIDKSTIGYLSAATLPYALKPLWSPFIDGFKIPVLYRLLGRRRSWMFVIQAGLVGAIIMLANINPLENTLEFGLVTVFIGFLSASQDIVIDAYRIEILSDDEIPAGSVMIQFGARAGYVFAGVGALLLADHIGWQMTYILMSSLVLFGIVAALFCGEPDEPKTELMAQEEKKLL